MASGVELAATGRQGMIHVLAVEIPMKTPSAVGTAQRHRMSFSGNAILPCNSDTATLVCLYFAHRT